ncbi:MAG: DUF4258 domain-containing protein [Dehalococcoidia bacterium]|nr:DUF4258 domain-containing protein [Dehalococcoidia bacterium]
MRVYETPGGKQYGFLPHALERMSQRRIKRRDISHILDNYQASYTDRKGNLCLVGLSGENRKIRIVVAKNSDPLEILTAIVQD